MFESALLSGSSAARGRSVPLALAAAAHGAAILAVLGASLWRDEELPPPQPPITFVSFAPAPPPGGGPSGAPHRAAPSSEDRSAPAPAPRDFPAAVSSLPELPEAIGTSLDRAGATGGAFGGPEGVDGGTGETPGAVGPPLGGSPEGPLVIGGDVRPPALLERIDPDYPEAARKARLEGVVILRAVIGTDGRVEDIRLVKSALPLLDDSAIRAVRRWRYRPATLNGRAVRVFLTVTAEFRLR